jgi:hypothetical protein
LIRTIGRFDKAEDWTRDADVQNMLKEIAAKALKRRS